MFRVRDVNGNEYTVYHVQAVERSKQTSDGQILAETEVVAMFMIYNPYAKEWQWSDAEGWEPIEQKEETP